MFSKPFSTEIKTVADVVEQIVDRSDATLQIKLMAADPKFIYLEFFPLVKAALLGGDLNVEELVIDAKENYGISHPDDIVDLAIHWSSARLQARYFDPVEFCERHNEHWKSMKKADRSRSRRTRVSR